MHKLTRAERETTIRWDALDRIASIDSADPVTIRKLDKLVAQYPDTYRCIRVDDVYHAKRYEVPAKYIRFGKPASDAQRAHGRLLSSNLRRETIENTEEN